MLIQQTALILLHPPPRFPPTRQAERYATGARNFEFDSALAPYDLHAYNAWRRLSGHISAAVIDAVQPLAGAWGGE